MGFSIFWTCSEFQPRFRKVQQVHRTIHPSTDQTADNVSLGQGLIQVLQIRRTRILSRKTQRVITGLHQTTSRIMPNLVHLVHRGYCVLGCRWVWFMELEGNSQSLTLCRIYSFPGMFYEQWT